MLRKLKKQGVNRSFTFVKRLGLIGACISSAILFIGYAGFATGDEPTNSSHQRTHASKSKWTPQVDSAFTNAELKWKAATDVAKSQLSSDFQKIAQGIDGAAIAEEVVSWNSKFKMLEGNDAFRRWLHKRFRELMVDPDDLKTLVRRRLEQLHAKLTSIDNELLVAIRADVSTDFNRVALPNTDLTSLERELNAVVSQGEEAAWVSVAEFAASSGASWLADDAATTFFRELGQKDGKGQVTPDTELAAWIFGGIIGIVTDQVISDTVDVKRQLEAKLESSVATAMNRLLLGQPGSICWVKSLEKLQEHHRTGCLNAISSRFGTR